MFKSMFRLAVGHCITGQRFTWFNCLSWFKHLILIF